MYVGWHDLECRVQQMLACGNSRWFSSLKSIVVNWILIRYFTGWEW